jgi:hypothetical protein
MSANVPRTLRKRRMIGRLVGHDHSWPTASASRPVCELHNAARFASVAVCAETKVSVVQRGGVVMLNRFGFKAEGPDSIPMYPHDAILVFESSTTHVPGDERSRTHPGHGYPAHDVTMKTCVYWVVRSGQLTAAVEHLERRNDSRMVFYSVPVQYRVIEANPRTVSRTVKIDVDVGAKP